MSSQSELKFKYKQDGLVEKKIRENVIQVNMTWLRSPTLTVDLVSNVNNGFEIR